MPRRRGEPRKGRKPRLSKAITHLPNEVLSEIFNKLPLNSVVISRLVCKEWYSLISNPKFMHDYFNPIGKRYILFMITSSFEYDIYDLNCSNLINNNGAIITSSTPPLEHPFKWYYNDDKLDIIGSCNGLIALGDETNLVLWNPITKIGKSFSRDYWFFQPNCLWNNYEARVLWALCYDDDRDEFSVVVVVHYQSPPASPTNFDGHVNHENTEVYVVDVKTGKYRRLKHDALTSRLLDGKLFSGEAGKVVCGFPHWVVKLYDFEHPFVQREILYFDVKDEKFKQMARPNQGDEKTIIGLATMEGEQQLGVVLHHVNACIVEVWVMKEYGKAESWTNLLVIPYNPLRDIEGSLNSMDVVGFMPNGELLIQRKGRWWTHDLENGTSREIEFRKNGIKNKGSILVAYEPSFISNPKSDKGRERTSRKKIERSNSIAQATKQVKQAR